ncbi:Lrp/AsnC family transcriptional regulator, partial [Burkholderia multivorans]
MAIRYDAEIKFHMKASKEPPMPGITLDDLDLRILAILQ